MHISSELIGERNVHVNRWKNASKLHACMYLLGPQYQTTFKRCKLHLNKGHFKVITVAVVCHGKINYAIKDFPLSPNTQVC